MPNYLIVILGFGSLIYGGFETAIAVLGTSEPEAVTLADSFSRSDTSVWTELIPQDNTLLR